MSDEKIPPALAREEWLRLGDGHCDDRRGLQYEGLVVYEAVAALSEWSPVCVTYDSNVVRQPVRRKELPVLIALANHALPDDDPRKITREMVELIRDEVSYMGSPFEADPIPDKRIAALEHIAAILESYLPPEA